MDKNRVFCGLLLAGWWVFAATDVRAAETAIDAAESTIQIGINAGYGQYHQGSPLFSGGARVGGDALFGASRLGVGADQDLYAGVEYDFGTGLISGHRQAGPMHGTDTCNLVIVRLGLGLPVLGGAEMIPYLAGGYQSFNQNKSNTQFYGAHYQARLVGSGLKLALIAGPAFVVSASAEGLAVIGGMITPPLIDASGTVGTAMQERVSLVADYRFTSTWHAFAGLGLTHESFTGTRGNNCRIFLQSADSLQVNSTIGMAYGF